MTPVFKIEANGEDVTAALQENMSSISFRDEDGNQSDEITIRVLGDFKRPQYKDELKLWFGYEEQPLFYCGSFLVQTSERDLSGLTITATGADFSESLKQKRDLSYEKLSLKDIAQMVATRHGLKFKSDFDDMNLTHLSQTSESDLHLMKRLADEYNGLFSIKNSTLILVKRIKNAKKSEDIPVFEIDAKECSSLSIKHANKMIYNSCTATWHDTKENTVKSITVGDGDPILKLDGQFKTAAEAKAKAEAKLERASRGTKSGSISIYGKEIYAGSTLKLTGANEDDGEYSIKSISHSYGNGWSMNIEIEN
jgi:Bacteriophage probable baseplate hub protein